VEIPVLVLSGTKDLSATPDAMRATAKVYKKSEFVSIDGGTHMLPMEQSEKASEALGAFRDRVEAESRAVR
jgi:pimeloyl-ACP methyl ester carboxylesterase